jgi:hypothetical protein
MVRVGTLASGVRDFTRVFLTGPTMGERRGVKAGTHRARASGTKERKMLVVVGDPASWPLNQREERSTQIVLAIPEFRLRQLSGLRVRRMPEGVNAEQFGRRKVCWRTRVSRPHLYTRGSNSARIRAFGSLVTARRVARAPLHSDLVAGHGSCGIGGRAAVHVLPRPPPPLPLCLLRPGHPAGLHFLWRSRPARRLGLQASAPAGAPPARDARDVPGR